MTKNVDPHMLAPIEYFNFEFEMENTCISDFLLPITYLVLIGELQSVHL